jgi:hypothetical protein
LRERRRALRLAVRPCGRGTRHRCRRRSSRWIARLPCERDGPPCGEPGPPCDEPWPPCGGPAIRIPRPLRADKIIVGGQRRRKVTCPRVSAVAATYPRAVHVDRPRVGAATDVEVNAGWDRIRGRGVCGGETARPKGLLADLAPEPADRAAGDAGTRVHLEVGGAAVRGAVEPLIGKGAPAQTPAVRRARRDGDGPARSTGDGGVKHGTRRTSQARTRVAPGASVWIGRSTASRAGAAGAFAWRGSGSLGARTCA